MTQLAAGDRAPEFALPDQNGRTVTLGDLCASTDKGVIVYFYPKASTPGCTKEACDFRDSLASLQGLHRRHPLDRGGGPRRDRGAGPVQRASHRSCQAAARRTGRGLSGLI